MTKKNTLAGIEPGSPKRPSGYPTIRPQRRKYRYYRCMFTVQYPFLSSNEPQFRKIGCLLSVMAVKREKRYHFIYCCRPD